MILKPSQSHRWKITCTLAARAGQRATDNHWAGSIKSALRVAGEQVSTGDYIRIVIQSIVLTRKRKTGRRKYEAGSKRIVLHRAEVIQL